MIIDDGGPAYPEPFFYMVNSMSTRTELQAMARELSYQVKDMPKGISLRDLLIGQILAHLQTEALLFMEAGGERREQVIKIVDIAEEIADEYLRRRVKRREKECVD